MANKALSERAIFEAKEVLGMVLLLFRVFVLKMAGKQRNFGRWFRRLTRYAHFLLAAN